MALGRDTPDSMLWGVQKMFKIGVSKIRWLGRCASYYGESGLII
jgi:hypothetical protein